MSQTPKALLSLALLLLFLSVPIPPSASAQLLLGAEELVQSSDTSIAVPGYSVPSYVFWDGDVLRDLVVGEGGGIVTDGKVRVYLNEGTAIAPEFSSYFYVQSSGSDLVVPASG
ncbi:MAG: hypothetical protein JSW03_00820 [Candidatus Eiseniibacteriota bacterium]|nr:MAG: hypothetical protein JSW03_00820 [Candidatus Eisenbacteria bacterium]